MELGGRDPQSSLKWGVAVSLVFMIKEAVFLPSEFLLGVRVSSDGRGDLRRMLKNLDEFGVVVMIVGKEPELCCSDPVIARKGTGTLISHVPTADWCLAEVLSVSFV